MAPNVTEDTSTLAMLNRDRACADVFVNKGRGEDESQHREQIEMSTSPVSVTSFLSCGAFAPSGDEASHHRDGTFEVRRSARKRSRIKRGSLASSSDDTQQFNIAYRIYHPELLASCDAAPLIVLHGGPSFPSGYLYPIADQITSRSVIFYDQLGCGRSEGSEDVNMYSISHSVDDLEALIKALSLRRFHLYGHSFGGILAYEYVKRAAERPPYENCANADDVMPECLSVILSNTSTSVELSDAESDRILTELRAELGTDDASTVERELWRRHQCRTEGETPRVLRDSIENVGFEWFRTDRAVTGYAAADPSRWARRLPPALIVGGEHDFVTAPCIEGWAELFNHDDLRVDVMSGCAHYCHLEDPNLYGELIRDFLNKK